MTSNVFEMLPIEEFAGRMGVSRSTVFAWLAKGYLAEGKIYVRIGKTIRFIWSIESVAAMSRKAVLLADSEEMRDPVKGSKQAAVNLNY